MSAFDEREVLRIARLARLSLTPEEVRRFAGEFSRILDYMRQIQALDLAETPPARHPLPPADALRADEPSPSLPAEDALRNAPRSKGGLFGVPPLRARE